MDNHIYQTKMNIKYNGKWIKPMLFIGILTVILILVLPSPSLAKADNNEYEIENGVLISYTGDGGDITIPDSVTAIRDFAFDSNNTITSVIIPNSVVSIGIEAFWNCINLSKIYIPNSVKYIGSDAFSLTPWIESQKNNNPLVVVNDILIDGHACEGSIVIGSNVKHINTHAFAFNTKINKITLSNTVKSIGTEAFVSCKNLDTVIMKDSVRELGEYVFSDCTSLVYVKISNALGSIPKGTFEKCSNLANITIPYSVTKISNAFDSCKKLKSMTLSRKVTSINKAAFDYCNKPTIYGIKDSYTYKYANKYNIAFKSLTISDKKINLSIGDVKTLKLNGSSICVWKTSDKSIATVNSSGKVTAKGKGNAVITACIYNQEYKCEVEVK